MTRPCPSLKVVGTAKPDDDKRPRTQLQKSRALARAFIQRERALALLADADAAIDVHFPPWAAGRSISRDEARRQLISTGHLPERKP